MTRFCWPDGVAVNHDPDSLLRTQDLPPIYEENSCIYLFSRTMFEARKHRIGGCPMMFPIDRFEGVEIGEESDLVVAEGMMEKKDTADTQSH